MHWGWLAFVASVHAAGLIALANRDILPSAPRVTEPSVIEISLITQATEPKPTPVAKPTPARPEVRQSPPTVEKAVKTPPTQAKPPAAPPTPAAIAAQPPKPPTPPAPRAPPETSSAQVASNPHVTAADNSKPTSRQQDTTPASGVTAPAAPPAIQKPVVTRTDAQYLDTPPPAYPRYIRKRGMEGKVLLKVEILADGSAGTVEIVEKSPFPQLDELARDKVRTWRFVPARRGDKAINSSMTVPIEFRLTD